MKSALVWVVRLFWAVQVLTLGPAIGQALEGRSRPVQVVGTWGPWVVWAAVLLATLVPTTVSLTVLRSGVPAATVAAVLAWCAGASTTSALVGLGGSLAVLLVAFSGDLGEVFVQGSAYGHERRLPLRPPAALLIAVPTAWMLLVASLTAGALGLAARSWWWAAPVAALGLALAPLLGRRFHRLSRRWLVLVPAGVVVHDHLVLAETAMFLAADVMHAALALEGTEAANLTGTALGPVVEVRLRNMATVVLAAPPRGTTRALHVQSVLVSPTRPGRALAAISTASSATR
ncbi:MAG: hypothetical protein RL219_1706 [Actinomycetota bacterium]|jgi:hypothetical protein